MANVLVNDLYLSDIADAIREKLDTEDTYKPSEMADAIESISGGSSLGTKSITANGTYNASSDSLDGYSQVTVNVSGSSPSGTKSITANGTGIDVAAYAYADVAVPNTYASGDEGKVVSNGALVSQSSDTVTTNGTVDTTLINSLTVNVSGGGGSTFPKTGTITPESRTTSISFDVGTTDTIKHVVVVPTSESPYKSGGKTVAAVISNAESSFYKYIGCTSNNSGAGALTPALSDTNSCFTQSGSVITVSPTSAGSFETISYTWFAW